MIAIVIFFLKNMENRESLKEEYCDLTKCRLRMGTSKAFATKYQKRRANVKYHGFEYLKKMFDSINGRKILNKCETKMAEVYPGVMNGNRKTIVTSPPHFYYTAKLKEGVVFEEGMGNDKGTNEEATLEDIFKFRKDFLPQAGERDIFNPVLGAFYHHSGIFVNTFEPNMYLKEFFKAGKNYRDWEIENKSKKLVKEVWMPYILKQFPPSRRKYLDKIKGHQVSLELDKILEEQKGTSRAVADAKKRFKTEVEYTEVEVEESLISCLKSGPFFLDIYGGSYEFNELEENLLEANGKNAKEVDGMVGRITKRINAKTKDVNIKGHIVCESINEEDICKGMENDVIKNLVYKVMCPFDKEKEYVMEDIKSSLRLTLYENLVKPPGEWDFLVILTEIKIVLNIEVKKQIDMKDRKKNQLNRSLISASHQCESHANYAAEVLGPFLGDDWVFLKVAAIIPGNLDREKICSHCDPFVITGEDENELRSKFEILKNNLFLMPRDPNIKEDRGELIDLLKVLVGLSFLSTEHPEHGGAWKNIQGNDPDHVSMSAGWTLSEAKGQRFEELINVPQSFNRLVYYNADQQTVLANRPPLVILKGDFGSGM